MKRTDEILAILRELKPLLRERFGVRRLALFGSVSRGEATEGSDIDILVEMPPSLSDFMALRRFLEERLGATVDLGTFRSMRRYVMRQAQKDIVDV
ncbi:nucleotidyltransferase family protein [Hydrogenimonas sp.]